MHTLQTTENNAVSAARRLLFRDSYRVESPAEIVRWWEQRRVPFNIAVGISGLLSVSSIVVLSAIGPYSRGFGGPPLIAIVAYALLANLAYTMGWVSELLLRPVLGARTGTVGATIFRYGLVFSVGLSALPMAVSVIGYGFRVMRWLFGG